MQLPNEDFSASSVCPESANLSLAGDDFSRFFELSLDLFCIANLQGFFLRVNPNFSSILGYSETELLTRPFLDFVHPHDHAATLEEMERLQEGLAVIRFRNRYRARNNHYHLFEWTAKAENGLVYAVARDHSEQMRLTEELQANRIRERAILDRTPAVVYVKGVDHKYQFINQQFADLFLVTLEEIIGQDDRYLFADDVVAQITSNDQEVIRTGEALTVEEHVPHQDGLHTYISVKFPLLDSQGAITAVAGISTDISDRLKAKEAEQELQLAQAFQRTLYPESPPEISGLEIAGAAFPVAHVCGDYFDYIVLDEDRLSVSLGDVAGHGYKPALQMVELRTSLRILLRTTSSLQTAVENLNEILCADFAALPSFVSFFLAMWDVPQRTLRYIGAGHDAFLLKADGRIVNLDSTGLVLGVVPELSYPEAIPVAWEPGDVFAVFTDGFNEAFNIHGEQFGKERVLASLLERRNDSCQEMIENLFQALKSFVGETLVQDDMTVVVVKGRE